MKEQQGDSGSPPRETQGQTESPEHKVFPSALKRLREVSGLSLNQLADRARVSTSALSRWERGEATPKRDNAEMLDKSLDAKGDLLKTWTSQTSGSTLPLWMQDAARLEEEAVSIEYISPVLVPGLLQSPQYAEVVFRHGQPLAPQTEIARLAEARTGRYGHLKRSRSPWVSAVFPASALTGFPRNVRVSQAKHLLKLIADDDVTVHVVPEGTVLIGITSPVVMVRLPGGGRAGSSDHISGNVVLDDHVAWDRLDELAKRAFGLGLPTQQSYALLEELGEIAA